MATPTQYSKLRDFGHHLVVGFAGPELLSEERKFLSELAPTGVVLFAKNIASKVPDWQAKLAELLADVRQAIGREDLLVSIDHEGGRVHRFPTPVSHFPPALTWGDQAALVGEAMAKELRALGFNLDFAPVLDCFSEPLNKVIGDRALACEFSAVGPQAIAFARGMERHGVLACGKHFPGHGGTIADSHFELPHRDCSREELFANELVPFKQYIEADFPLVMSAHVLYPQLDPQQPASLSEPILNGLLREQLGFNGCLITDDLEMKALEHLTSAEKAVLAMQAGTDLLLEANYAPEPPLRRAHEMAVGLLEAVTAGILPREKLQRSRKRIDALLSYASKIRRAAPGAHYDHLTIGSAAHQALAQKLKS